MGILAECTTTPLSWSEIVPHVERIKELALGQFIAIYNQLKDRDERDQLRWGDEIEYVLVRFDESTKKARVSLRAEELLQELSVWETMNDLISYENRTLWRPEFASYMIEGTPGTPYGGLLESFRDVEKNMCLRRAELDRLLHENESLMSISFPALGVPDFTDPPMQKLEEDGKTWVSDFFSEEMINKCHPRFVYLTRNIIERRGGDRMSVNVPIFRDKCTPTPFIDEFVDPRVQHQLAKPDHIFLDHIGFGTGLCCLQVTIQGSDMDEARWLYDQLAPLTPLMVALSAATPIYRGMLANIDARWDVLAKLSDDRNPEERAQGGKTRFGTIDCFIHPTSAQFNDIPVPYEEQVMARLMAEGVDPAMAQHIAHLFIWDPLLVYAENLEQNKENGKAEENGGGTECTDDDLTTHFDSLQSSIWSSLRFKPPPSQRMANRLGWRVEFRPMEVQLTDFENAAFCCFLVLLSRVLFSDRLSLVMPISLIDQNMERAQQRDAVIEQKFHFRTDLERHGDRKVLKENGKNGRMNGQMGAENVENGEDEEGTKTATTINVRQMTVNEIINGDGADFPGLVPLCLRWLDSAGDAPLDVQTRGLIIEYLQFVQKRATGECATLARWMREFVAKHPDYKMDSLCPDSTIYDLLKEMDRMAKGESRSERLLGNFGQRKWLLEAKAAGKWRIHPNGKEKETRNELK